jgi:hypothetical protein
MRWIRFRIHRTTSEIASRIVAPLLQLRQLPDDRTLFCWSGFLTRGTSSGAHQTFESVNAAVEKSRRAMPVEVSPMVFRVRCLGGGSSRKTSLGSLVYDCLRPLRKSHDCRPLLGGKQVRTKPCEPVPLAYGRCRET